MASLKEIAREYRDEIMDGIAWVAIWKTGQRDRGSRPESNLHQRILHGTHGRGKTG